MRENPFVVLSGCDSNNLPVATQLPVLMEERNGELILQGHLMRKTDHHLAFDANPNVLALFTGPHAYVSSSWYAEDGIASTWNYMTVHASGKLEWMSDRELINFMKRFTKHFENQDEASPSIFDNLPKDFLDHMLPAIVGFEIKVEKLDHVFKMSQNRSKESFESIITELSKGDYNARELAFKMQGLKK